MAHLIKPTAPALSIFAALLGVGLTIATNAEQAFPCTTRHPRSRPTRGQILQSPYHQHGLRAPPPAGHPMTGGDEGPGVASPELNDVFLPYRVPHDDGRSQRFDASWIRLPVAPKSLPHRVVFELRVLLEGQTREGFQQEAPMGTTPRRRRSPRWIQEGSQGCTLSMVPERFLIHVGKLSRSRSQ